MDQNNQTKWVTKFVNQKEYNEYYAHHPSYILVRKVRGGVRLGFLIIGEIPQECIPATPEDKEIIYSYKESANHYPLPDVSEYYVNPDRFTESSEGNSI